MTKITHFRNFNTSINTYYYNILFLLLFIFIFCIELSECGVWKYGSEEDESDKDWHGLCKTGLRQSPIDLAKDNLSPPRPIEPIAFINYKTPVFTNITNNGHTVSLKLNQQKGIGIAAGGLFSYYELSEIHFHWGGSEHTFQNNRLEMEVHLVHYNSEYNSITDAKDQPRGLAVIAVLFYETKEDNPMLEPIIATMEEAVNDPGESTMLNRTFSPSELLPADKSSFFRYDGSLTTPPCSESVVWTVLYRTLGASKEQLEKFETLNSEEGSDIKYNFRRPHPYNNRKVYFVETETVNDRNYFEATPSSAYHHSSLQYLVSSTTFILLVLMSYFGH